MDATPKHSARSPTQQRSPRSNASTPEQALDLDAEPPPVLPDASLWRQPTFKGHAKGQNWKESEFEFIRCIGIGPRGRQWLAHHRGLSRGSSVAGGVIAAVAATLAANAEGEGGDAPEGGGDAPVVAPMAVKACEKSRAATGGAELDLMLREKDLCSSSPATGHPNVVSYFGTGQGARHVYFVHEFLQGGELFTHYRSNRGQNLGQVAGTMPAAHAVFYCSEIVLAIEHLHKHKIVYRNLRPETLLLDQRGHVRLADLGNAKIISVPTRTMVGHPDYTAPEVLRKGSVHGLPVDWWSLGVVLFEMLAGYLPFFDESPIVARESHSSADVDFPDGFEPRARDIVCQFLVADPQKRLGALRRGVADVKRHKFFTAIDWAAIAAWQVPPPLTITLDGPSDCRYFDEFPISDTPPSPPPDEDEQALFEGF